MRVSVIGGSECTDRGARRAAAVGRELADRGHGLVCGGLGGVMEHACRGASEAGGHTIGILPGPDRGAANPHVDTAVATGMGSARNVLVVLNGDAAIAVEGATGTLSELGHALDLGRPVAGLDTHRIDGLAGVEHVDGAQAAVEHVENALEGSP
jgi:uncharacterized protein (TIGR00725 family)